MNKTEKHEQLQKVLGTTFSINLLDNIESDWHEFYTNTELYADNDIIIDMVNLYLDDLNDGIDYSDDVYLDDYSSNCHCDTYGVCGGSSCKYYFECLNRG